MSTYNDIFEETIGITMPKSVENLDEAKRTKELVKGAEGQLPVFYEHITKWRYNPQKQSKSWVDSILDASITINGSINNNKKGNVLKNLNDENMIKKSFISGVKKANNDGNKIPKDAEIEFSPKEIADIDKVEKYLIKYAKDQDTKDMVKNKVKEKKDKNGQNKTV